MMQVFRNFLKSKMGMLVALVFLGLIALAFSGMDVSNTGAFGGVSGADRVAIVGDQRISTSEVRTNFNLEMEQARQQNPGMTREAYVASGGLDKVLDGMVSRAAISEFGRSIGLRAGTRLVDSQLTQMTQFQNAGGQFDTNIYRSVLSQYGYNDKMMRSYVAAGLMQQQVMTPLALNSIMPKSITERYAALQHERRTGQIGLLPSAAFAPKGDPTAAQLDAYYKDNKDNYMRPERRVIRYAVFSQEVLTKQIKAADSEIQERYQRDIDQYEAKELRTLTSLIVPLSSGADGAKAVRDEIAGGKSLEAAARERNLSASKGEPIEQDALATRDSAAVAQAAFATAKGQVTQPVRGRLGYYIVRVDNVETRAEKPLEQVKGEIATAIENEKRREALLDLSASIEEAVDDGSSLVEVADSFGLTLRSTDPLISNGAIYDKPGEAPPPYLRPVISTAFTMQEGQPQLDEIVPGTTFIVYDVTDITPASPAPLADIKPAVTAAWKQSEGAKAARAAADRVIDRLKKGSSMADAMAAEKIALPPVDTIDLNRSQLSDQQRVPAPLALMFSMAKGSTKKLETGGNNGWFIVRLDDIKVTPLTKDDPEIVRVGQELNRSLANEQGIQFIDAVDDQVGIERNEETIKTLKTELGGQGG